MKKDVYDDSVTITCTDNDKTLNVEISEYRHGVGFNAYLAESRIPFKWNGKVYVGTQGREFLVFAASKDKKIISSIELDSPINASPIAANGVLYVTTMKQLYAVQASTR